MGSLDSLIAALVVLSGCVSIGGGTTLNLALDDSPVRRGGGSYEIGNLVEIVESELVGQLFYARDLGPLGARSEALGAWGGRLTKTRDTGSPGCTYKVPTDRTTTSRNRTRGS